MDHGIFISFSEKDRDKAEVVCNFLESNGLSCWIASRNIQPGADWGEAILQAINSSRALVLLLSSRANTSNHVKREVERAVNRGAVVIPLRIEDVPPARALEYLLSTTQWLDAYMPPFEQHLAKLVRVITAIVDGKDAVEKVRGSVGPDQLPQPKERRISKGAVCLAGVAIVLIGLTGVLAKQLNLLPSGLSGTRREQRISQAQTAPAWNLSAADMAYVAATLDALGQLGRKIDGVKVSSSTKAFQASESSQEGGAGIVESHGAWRFGDLQITSALRVSDNVLNLSWIAVQYTDPQSIELVVLRASERGLESVTGPFSISHFDQALLSSGVQKTQVSTHDDIVMVQLAYNVKTENGTVEIKATGLAAVLKATP